MECQSGGDPWANTVASFNSEHNHVPTAVLQSRVWGLPVFSTLESSGFKEAGGKLHEFSGIKNCGCVQNKNRVGLGVIKQDSDPDCLGSSWVSLHHRCLWWEGHCPLDTLPFCYKTLFYNSVCSVDTPSRVLARPDFSSGGLSHLALTDEGLSENQWRLPAGASWLDRSQALS